MIERIDTTALRRITPADNSRSVTSGCVLSVLLAPDEEVEWIYTCMPFGRVASGYIIKKCHETKINQIRLGGIKL